MNKTKRVSIQFAILVFSTIFQQKIAYAFLTFRSFLYIPRMYGCIAVTQIIEQEIVIKALFIAGKTPTGIIIIWLTTLCRITTIQNIT